MACAGFLQRLWEKPIWEGVWPNLDPMDSVCLRKASVEWSVPGKYRPHGELFWAARPLAPSSLEIGCATPDLGDIWRFGCPKIPMWESEGEAWSENESVSSSDSRENNVSNGALHVIGLYGPGDKVSLFLKDWELARVALSCHIALDMMCLELHEAR